jgi:F420-dependent oxidoreductase-like protein
MRFAFKTSPQNTSWDDLLAVWRAADDIEVFESGWTFDHFYPIFSDSTGPCLEGWVTLTALAQATTRLRVGVLVTGIHFRHPAVLANIAATTDRICGGRLTLGIGAGWQENEHASYGIPLGTIRERLDRFEESVPILLGLLREPRTTFAGTYFTVTDAPNQPAPVQARMPLLIGGAGEKRTMRIAARYADEWNCWSTPDLLARKIEVLRRHCADLGRDPAEIHVSTQALLYLSTDRDWLDRKREAVPPGRPAIIGTPDEVAGIVAQYRDAGAAELIIPDATLGTGARKKDTCDVFLQECAAAIRG